MVYDLGVRCAGSDGWDPMESVVAASAEKAIRAAIPGKQIIFSYFERKRTEDNKVRKVWVFCDATKPDQQYLVWTANKRGNL